MLNAATQLISAYFQKPVHFSKVTQLSEPDRRNVILRLHISNPSADMPQSLILKKNSIDNQLFDRAESETDHEQLSRFAHDWAGLEFLTQIGSDHAPHFYAGNLEYRFIIIEDLVETHPSLVGPLTRAPSPSNLIEAKAALTTYICRLGKMHADTAGKFDQYTAILERIYPKAQRYHSISEIDAKIIMNHFRKLTGIETEELTNEIHSVINFSQSKNEFSVFLHGDICPDNVYYRDNEMRLIDFEFADFGNALIDSTYLRMHMPSCWCSKAVPKDIIDEMESTYRNELENGIPSARDNESFHKQLTYACAYWMIRTLKGLDEFIKAEWICPSGPVDIDSLWDPEKNGFRSKVLSRLDAFVATSKETGNLPAIQEAATSLRACLQHMWPGTSEIDLFPVFNSNS